MPVTPADFRRIVFAFPGVLEEAGQGFATFTVAGRLFASLGEPDADNGLVMLTGHEQTILLRIEPTVFRAAPGVRGRAGGTIILLETIDEPTLASAIRAAWRNVAPRRLVALFDRSGR